MDQDVEFPKNPDIIIENDGTITISDCVNKIMEYKVNVKDTFDRDVNYWNQYYLRKEKRYRNQAILQNLFCHIWKHTKNYGYWLRKW